MRRPGSGNWVASVHLAQRGGAIGSGFLIDERRVLTCAHVTRPKGRPAEELWVAFPKLPDLMVRRVKVAEVVLPDPDVLDGTQADVAVLVLSEPVPAYAAARLRRPTPDDLVGQAWWSFGFPHGQVLGNSADGSVGEALAFGWVRLDTGSRYPVQPGFSGSALWSPEYDAVVGIVGQANGGNGDAQAITLWMADLCLPEQKLGVLASWSAEAAGDGALAAWGWTLDRDPEARRHWRPRARGVSTDAERGFRFRGRSTALNEIVYWLHEGAERQALVVTGSPGVGKSAVLGRIVTTADADVVATLPPEDDAVRARVGSVACAVHAKGKTAMAVAEEIARGASAALPAAPQDLALVLRDALMARRPPHFNVVIDALDEAATPADARAVITGIVQPLVETCSDLGVRVVLGSRRRDNGGGLLSVFGTAMRVIDLDTATYFSEADLAAYALATLQLAGDERPDSPYRDEAVAGPVAHRIAALSEQNFLIAGLVARTHGMADRTPVAPRDVAFTPTVDAALREYLKLLPPVDGVPAWDAMTALAYAEAPGVPLALWRAAIRALFGVAVPEDALRAFARSSAANFLVETMAAEPGDAGGRILRLFHQALDDALLGARADLDMTAADEGKIARALTELGRATAWTGCPDYLLAALPGHAARGGVLDDLLLDDSYLLRADLGRIIPLAGATPAGSAAMPRSLLLRKTPRAIHAGPAARAALFSVTAARDGLAGGEFAAEAPYRGVWAAVTARQEDTVLEGHQGTVALVCEVPVGERSLMAAVDDRAVRVWDPTSGDLLRTLPGDARSVLAVCAVPTGHGTVLATAGADHLVRLWDPLTGQLVRTLAEHTGAVRHLCHVRLGERDLLVSAGDDVTVRLWDPVSGQNLQTLHDHAGPLAAVAPEAPAGGYDIIVARGPGMGGARSLRLWGVVPAADGRAGDAASGGPPVRYFPGSRDETTADTLAADPGGRFVAEPAGADVRLWNLRTGRPGTALEGHRARVLAVCAVPVPGDPLVAGAGSDGTIRVWETGTGLARRVLRGHTSAVRTVCAVSVGHRVMLASGGDDGTVRIWDPSADGPEGADGGPSGRDAAPTGGGAVAVVRVGGRTVLAHAGTPTGLVLWGLDTGREVTRHPPPPPTVVDLHQLGENGEVCLVGGGSGGVRLWDPGSGRTEVLGTGPETAPPTAVCGLRPAGRTVLAVGHDSGAITFIARDTGRLLPSRHRHTRSVSALREVRVNDFVMLASASADHTVRLWGAAAGDPLQTLRGHEGAVTSLAELPGFGPQGVLLASGSADLSVRLWDPVSGDHLATLNGHSGPVTALSTVRVGRETVLASASTDRTVRVWSPRAGQLLAEIPVYSPAMALAADGDVLVVSLADGLLALRLAPALLPGHDRRGVAAGA
ncbi:trypsin-like serine protease [Kitasatospora sp. NBC_00458]|uniref:trypsin-like serine protease n=1 Tax=Kitasatospora sp. NBC_00458 TaxID=2903568 RepID=UPI002E178D72